ncbi:MAG: type II secretion system F family protein, partial [Steroidobacteraceae bacterium]
MAAFEYTALDAHGREVRGVQEGESPRQVRQWLRDQQLLPMQVTAVTNSNVTQRGLGKRSSFTRNRISNADLALLTRQLATLVKAALPLEDALRAVAEQSEKPAVQKIVTAVRARVTEGLTLASALGEFPRVFPEIYRATVAAGEQSGRLDVVLERLADYTENRDQLRQRVIGALLYPIVLTVMCIAIIAGLLTYVVPKVVEVFESGQNALPWMTQVLLAVSEVLRDYGLWLLLVIVIVGVLFKRWLRAP